MLKMIKNNSPKRPKTAFSLLELSIVILIVAILIVGSMSASVVAINNAKYKVTKDRVKEIYKAMGSYLLVNKALPCPASITDLKSNSSYGESGTEPGVCNAGSGVYAGGFGSLAEDLVYGAIPIKALGLSADMAEDGFGSKFTYVVSAAFTNPDISDDNDRGFGNIYPASGFTEATAKFITVKENLGGSSFQTDTNEAIFVIISHGNNKSGAFNSNSATQNSASTDEDEQNNYATAFTGSSGGTANFYSSNNYFTSSSPNSDVFDDVVFYKTRNAMLMDFDALSLIVCGSTATNNSNDNHGDYLISGSLTEFIWPQTYYDQIAVSTTSCSTADAAYITTVTYPTKKCGAFGVWQAGAINPCTN